MQFHEKTKLFSAWSLTPRMNNSKTNNFVNSRMTQSTVKSCGKLISLKPYLGSHVLPNPNHHLVPWQHSAWWHHKAYQHNWKHVWFGLPITGRVLLEKISNIKFYYSLCLTQQWDSLNLVHSLIMWPKLLPSVLSNIGFVITNDLGKSFMKMALNFSDIIFKSSVIVMASKDSPKW